MAAANVPTSFRVDMRNAGDAKLNVRVVSPYGKELPVHVQGNAKSGLRIDYTPYEVAPYGKELPVHVQGNAKSGLRIDYTPYEVGIYKVFVECAGVPAKGSPFNCNVFDPSLIRINAPGRAYFGRPIHFNLDTSAAGRGKLDFQVTCRGHDVPTRLREVGAERFDVSFTPQHAAPHRVHVNFNDMEVPGEPHAQSKPALFWLHNFKPFLHYFADAVATLNLIATAVDEDDDDDDEKEEKEEEDDNDDDDDDGVYDENSPNGNTLPARLSHHGNNTSRVSFTPLEVGLHRVHVMVGDTPVSGSPFTCSVYDPAACRITDVDKTAKREREIGFIIDSSAAGAGTLEVEVTHRGQAVRTECYKQAEGRYHYTFRPKEVGRYEVKATFNGDSIPGTPLIIDVEEDTPTFIRINFSSSEPMRSNGRNWFLLQMNGQTVDRGSLSVLIKGCQALASLSSADGQLDSSSHRMKPPILSHPTTLPVLPLDAVA
ncbi:low quality protein: filamin-a-like [Plakobranchus ocellatus]|uniref:Low quality protein: filamin-a-like n=1 Tax=Plakobranchus ocellatus TaxID=259542 RepID=A0AAV4BHJ0_9GAST|nr:low quality protein: filamin-a-like [Plakobranchus ocellatus]